MKFQEIADRLGQIRAEIKDLQHEQKALEDRLKAKHVEAVDGNLFRVSISYEIESSRVDWKSVAAKLKPSHQLVAAHTNRSIFDRVNVSALTKSQPN